MRKKEGKGMYPHRYIYGSEYSNSMCPYVVMMIIGLQPGDHTIHPSSV